MCAKSDEYEQSAAIALLVIAYATGAMDLEYSLVRVPYERLSNVFKNSTKSIEKDIGLIIQNIQQLAKKKDVKKAEGLQLLDKFSQRLEMLKKKVLVLSGWNSISESQSHSCCCFRLPSS
jgi:ABC-type Fe3+-hydroxamate transport system substrate-binding protein